jgi:chemotaxis protein MotB
VKRFRPAANPHLVRASGDRWLFGYADVVTLLLACFASLYASTLAPATSAVAAGPASAVETDATTPAGPTTTTARAEDAFVDTPAGDAQPATPAAPATIEPTSDSLEEDLRALFDAGAVPRGVELSATDRGLVLSVPEAGSFPAGQAELSAEARLMMRSLAAGLQDGRHLIRVEGHTDDVPVRGGRYRSNWELSTARATTVVEFLIEEGRLDPGRLSAAGYAEYHPRLDNGSPANRARNRRVDIVIFEPPSAH